MSHAIVQIGGNHYLCPSVAIGAKLVEHLGKCVQVDGDFVADGTGHHRYVYTALDPSTDRLAPVELKIVSSDQIRKPVARVPKNRRLGAPDILPPTP